MIKSNKLILVLLVFILQTETYARSRENAPDTTEVVAPTITNDGYKEAADQAYVGQTGAVNKGKVVGGTLMTAAAACYGSGSFFGGINYAYCHALAAAGALSYVASRSNAGSAANSQNLSCQFSNSCPEGTNAGPTARNNSPTGSPDTSTVTDPEIQKGIDGLKKVGVTLDFNKQTVSAGGKTFPMAAVTSPEAMAKAGLDPKDFSKLKGEVQKVEKKVAATADGGADFSVSAGGGGGGHGGSSETSGALNANQALTMAKDPVNRDPAQVIGLKTLFNGEPIGVASDSIFGIIDRRYEFHQKQGSFLSPMALGN